MPKLRLLSAAALSLALAGCHQSTAARNSDIRFTIKPTGNSVAVTCSDSSTGKCHFAFASQPTTTVIAIETGSTVPQVFAGIEYCAEPHSVSLESCKKSQITAKRQNVEKRSSDDAPVSN
jgi:hypothetical protein